MEVMIHHTAAVARAKPGGLIVGDMPWLSYHVSVEEAVRNAGRFIREGRAECVKLEGGRKRLAGVKGILAAGIPVVGQPGVPPQQIPHRGGSLGPGTRAGAARECG